VTKGLLVPGRVLVAALVVACGVVPAWARRAPAPGGTAVVSVPPELLEATLEAHSFAPLFVPRGGQLGGDVATPGAPEHTSNVIAELEPVTTAGEVLGTSWRLRAWAPAPDVAHAVTRCLAPHAVPGSKTPRTTFASAVLAAAGVTVEVVGRHEDVVVRFNKPVFVVAELLTACPLRPASGAPTGPYAVQAPGRLAWRSGSYEAPPLLGAIELRGPLTGSERADVVVAHGESSLSAGATLLSPWPDVIALVQEPDTVVSDPLGLADDEGAGLFSFRQGLRADLLAATWGAGRGGPTEALLPPGVAPARPLPPPPASAPSLPLALVPLPRDAPRVTLAVGADDALSDAVAERLAVLLRGRRTLLEVKRGEQGKSGSADVELVRWRPPSRDAAVSLLAFVGARAGLLNEPAVQKATADARLLGADPAQRLGAALALERALLDERLVVPLIVVDRSIVVDPDLRGVILRGDGVPLLDGAWWGGGR